MNQTQVIPIQQFRDDVVARMVDAAGMQEEVALWLADMEVHRIVSGFHKNTTPGDLAIELARDGEARKALA